MFSNWQIGAALSLPLAVAAAAAVGGFLAVRLLGSIRQLARATDAVALGVERLQARLLRPEATPLRTDHEHPGAVGSEVMPDVIISRAALDELAGTMAAELRREPHLENGVALVGRIESQPDGRRTIIINGLIGPGERTSRSATHVRVDRDYQQAQLERLQLLDARASHIGDAHTHPGSLNECSTGDRITDEANVRASATKEMVFVIATVAWSARDRQSAEGSSLVRCGLRLNFFYMGKASGYAYRRITPHVESAEPVVRWSKRLEEWACTRGLESFRLELACLRSIAGWSLDIQDDPSEQEAIILSLVPAEGGTAILLVLDRYPHDAPERYVSTDGGDIASRPVGSNWTSSIWLHELVLELIETRQSIAPIPVCRNGDDAFPSGLGLGNQASERVACDR